MKKHLLLATLFLAALPAFAQKQTTSATLTLRCGPTPLVLVPASGALAPATVGTPYQATVAITGGTSPYTLNVSAGAFPPGVSASLSGATITIAGTPTDQCAVNPCSFTLSVTDSSK